MATPTVGLVTALRVTARRLDEGAHYKWAHMGACNCGHLLQTISDLGEADIHRMATTSPGDWGQQAQEHCPTSGLPMGELIDRLLLAGLSTSDIHDLERLANRKIAAVAAEQLGARHLDHRRRSHVVAYLRAWADRLEQRLRAIRAGDREAA